MKLSAKRLYLLLAIFTAIFFQNCGGGEYLLRDEFQSKTRKLVCEMCTRTWQPLAGDSAPSIVGSHFTQQNDDGIGLWSQAEGAPNGKFYFYNIASDTWSSFDPGVAFREQVMSAGAGARIIFWSGANADTKLDDGFIFDSQTNEITKISNAHAPSGRVGAVVTMNGNNLFVWGGYRDGYLADGALLDLANNRWTELPASNLEGRSYLQATSIGEKIYLWGGLKKGATEQEMVALVDGAIYDVVAQEWQVLEQNNQVQGRMLSSLKYVPTLNSLLLVGGWDLDSVSTGFNLYSLADRSWQTLAMASPNLELQAQPLIAASDQYLYIWSTLENSVYAKGVYNFSTGVWGQYPVLEDVDFVPTQVFAIQDKFLMIGTAEQNSTQFKGFFLSQ